MGATARVARPGDFFTAEVDGEPIVVTRDADGILRAVYNVCRHRAARVASGSGNRASIHVVSWGPFVFVNLDERPAAIESWASVFLPADVARMRDMVPYRGHLYQVDCDWKVYVDNVVHPAAYRDLDYEAAFELEIDGMGSRQRAICVEVQRGLRSRSYERGRLSAHREASLWHFHRLVAEHLDVDAAILRPGHASKTVADGWTRHALEQLISIAGAEEFPCVFARRAIRQRDFWFTCVEEVASTASREMIREAMKDFLGGMRAAARRPLTPLLVLVRPRAVTAMVGDYHDEVWALLQYLHDHDDRPWPAEVPRDPESGDWSFCFDGEQIFVNVSNPAQRYHRSRILGDGLVLVVEPRTNFDVVAGNNPKGHRVRAEIEHRIEAYEGHAPPRSRGFYGTPDNREWRQMAIEEPGVAYPDRCPLSIRKP